MSVQTEIDRLSSAKTSLKTAIEAKGVDVADNAHIDNYADYVNQIPIGISEIDVNTDTSITGLLKGASGKVAQAVAGTDYESAGTAANAVSTHNTAGDAHSTLFAGKAEVATYNAMLTTTYAEDSNGYQAQTVNVSGLLATDTPTIDCVLSGTDKDADTAVLEAFSLINRATTGAGTLTVQCIGDAPTVAIPITLQVVR